MNLLEETLVLLVASAFTGILLKLADSLGEKGNNLKAFMAAGGAALGFWLLVKTSAAGSTLGLAIILGCLAGLKVDRPNLWFGLLLFTLLVLLSGCSPPILHVLLLLSVLAAGDEYLHRYEEGLVGKITLHRPLLKVGAPAVTLLGMLSPASIPAIYAFDLSYEALSRLLGEASRNPREA